MSEVVDEIPGFLQVLLDGSVKRVFAPEPASATSLDHRGLGFKSKDVVICPRKPIAARIFVPTKDTPPAPTLLPLLVYFHGGGFCVGSTTWPGYHRFLGGLSAATPCVILSVDYRLAPEHPFPAAYEDCLASLQWVQAQVQTRLDPWLARADLSRVFLAGDSAGGNIAHFVALKPVPGVRVLGLAPIHPFFGSQKRTLVEAKAEEAARGKSPEMAASDLFWRLSLPPGSDRDHPNCNFEVAASGEATWRDFPATAVFVAEKDFLKDRGEMYARFLEEKGVKHVRLIETKDESHVFHLFYPESVATVLLQRQLSEFINSTND